MTIPLRVLIVEDAPDDAELMVLRLVEAGFQPDWQRVETEPDYLAALETPPDLILADWSLPQFSGLRALHQIHERGLDIPFIMVSGSIGEEAAIDALRQGASDYVLKDRPARLGQAVQRALEDKRLRETRQQAAEVLRVSEARYREFIDATPDLVFVKDDSFRYLIVNQANQAYFGKTETEIIGKTDFDLMPEQTARACQQSDRQALETHHVVITVEQVGEQFFETRKFPVTLGESIGVGGVIRNITAQKKAEESLHLQSTALEAAANAIVITNRDGSIAWANTAFTALTGYTLEESLDRNPRELVRSGLHDQSLYRSLWDTILDGQVWRGELINRRKDGSLYTEEQTITPVHNAQGKITHFVAIKQDVTERKRAEEHIRYQANLIENISDAIISTTSDFVIRSWNKAAETLYGWTAQEAIGKVFGDIVQQNYPHDNRENILEQFRAVGFWKGEVIQTHRDSTQIWVLSAVSLTRDSAGNPTGAVAINRDITERKRLEAKEHDQRVLAESLAETASALTRALDLDGVMNTILENVARVVPHDAANIMLIEGDQAHVVYWRGYRPERIYFLQELRIPLAETQHLQHMLATRSSFLAAHTDQHPGWVRQPHTEWVKSYVAAPIRSHENLIGFLNVDSGVPGFFTEDHAQRLQSFADQASVAIEHAQLYEEIRRHSAELEQRVEERTAQLNHAKERIEAILNSSSDVMILCRTDSAIDQVNPAFDESFGYIPDEVYNRPLMILAVPEHVSLLEQTFKIVMQTRQPQRLEITVRCKTSTTFDGEMMLSPVAGLDSQLLGVVCSLRDITERKKMEVYLRQMLEHEMELSELKSRYVSMAAHDLRNPLAAIQTTLEVIQNYSHRLTEEQKLAKFNSIRHSIKTMVELLNDTLTIGQAGSGKLRFEPGPVDLVTFSEDLVAELQQSASSTQRIRFSHQGLCATVYMDAKLLRHILSNLLSNALKYSPADSPVTLDIHCESNMVRIRIQDRGIGIPQADQARLFEAFHRAGNVGSTPGTGLGLAIVKQSIDLHDGTITFESEEGVGTTFTVIFPQTPTEK